MINECRKLTKNRNINDPFKQDYYVIKQHFLIEFHIVIGIASKATAEKNIVIFRRNVALQDGIIFHHRLTPFSLDSFKILPLKIINLSLMI